MGKFKILLIVGGGILLLYLVGRNAASSIPKLILVVTAVVCFFLVRSYLRSKREREDRLAKPPEKAVIEVRVPKDMSDANARMKRFYSRIAQTTTADPEARRQGLGQLDILYIVERPPTHLTPILRFFVVSDPQTMPTVKRALKTAFEKQAEVFNLETDPLSDIVEQLRSIALAELEKETEETPPDLGVADLAKAKEQGEASTSA